MQLFIFMSKVNIGTLPSTQNTFSMAQTESNNTENVFWVLGRVRMFTFDMNMKSCIFPHLVLFHRYICVCVCISAIKPIIDVQRNLLDSVRYRCKHISCTEEYALWNYEPESEKLYFEPSQNATVTKCNKSGILDVTFCNLSHFVIIAVTAQTESNNTENMFWVLGTAPMFTFDVNMKSCILPILALFHCYICLCVCISVMKPTIDVQRKPSW